MKKSKARVKKQCCQDVKRHFADHRKCNKGLYVINGAQINSLFPTKCFEESTEYEICGNLQIFIERKCKEQLESRPAVLKRKRLDEGYVVVVEGPNHDEELAPRVLWPMPTNSDITAENYVMSKDGLIALLNQLIGEEIKKTSVTIDIEYLNRTMKSNCHFQNICMLLYAAFSPSIEEEIDNIYKLLLVKTLRAKFGAALKCVRENTVGHYAQNSSKESLRRELMHHNRNRMKEEGSKLKEETKKLKITKVVQNES